MTPRIVDCVLHPFGVSVPESDIRRLVATLLAAGSEGGPVLGGVSWRWSRAFWP